MSTVIQLFPDPEPGQHRAGPARSWLERAAPKPSPGRWSHSLRWWCTDGLARLGVLAVRAPLLAVLELRPIAVGVGRMLSGWADWVAATNHAEALRAAESHTEKYASELLHTQRGRQRMSLGGAVVLAGATWWAAVAYPLAVFAAAGLLILLADAVGRRALPTPTTVLPPPARAILQEGVPLTQITRALVDRAGERWGIELGIARAMTYSPARREYEVHVTSSEALTAEHMRDFERAIGAADHSLRCLAPPDRTASVRRLVIREGDPLAKVPPAPWIPTGSRSIAEPLDLGVSMTDTPFELVFAGEHIKAVGATGSGKTSWFLRNTIDRISACRDAVLWGIDLTYGPELPLWRGVVQRRAFTPEDAEQLLDAALAEIDRRAKILARFAADDDPANDNIIEWCAQLGPALVIVVDEFSTLAEFDGKGGRPNLLGKCEQIVRTGRKHWASLIALAQKTGNDDFGSTTMTTQANTSVALPCAPADAVRLFGVERRDAGYTPHLLQPGTKTERRDAGKCYLESPLHRTPDVYSCYAPMEPGEVKRRARQRLADGLPTLGDVELDEAVVLDPLLAEAERAFTAAGGDRLPSAVLLEHLQRADPGEWGGWSPVRLAEALRAYGMRPRPLNLPDGSNPRGYLRADLDAALAGAEHTHV